MKNLTTLFGLALLLQLSGTVAGDNIDWSKYTDVLDKYFYLDGTPPNFRQVYFWDRRDTVLPNGGDCNSQWGTQPEIQMCHEENGPWILSGCLSPTGIQVLMAKCVGKTWCNMKEQFIGSTSQKEVVAWCT